MQSIIHVYSTFYKCGSDVFDRVIIQLDHIQWLSCIKSVNVKGIGSSPTATTATLHHQHLEREKNRERKWVCVPV